MELNTFERIWADGDYEKEHGHWHQAIELYKKALLLVGIDLDKLDSDRARQWLRLIMNSRA